MVVVAEAQKAYRPYGAIRKLALCRDPEIMIDGPAGTGKTRGILEYLFRVGCDYPGARILLARATRASMTESVLVTWEEKVLPPQLKHPKISRRNRLEYEMPNGTVYVCVGLDKPERTFSTEYDIVYVNEATELSEDQWEKLTRPLRNNVVPWQQIIGDCNPSFPAHWILSRVKRGLTTRFPSRHEDNPTLTPAYLQRLANLTGHRRSRLYQGIWAAAEGLVYDPWDEALHVKSMPADYPWKRYILSIDAGYTNPCSMGIWGVDGDGRMHRIEEWYKTQQREAHLVERAAYYATRYDLEAVLVDPSAATLIAALEASGLPAVGADSRDVYGGIQLVHNRLAIAPDGLPRLTVEPTCTAFIMEVLSYLWKENRDGSLRDEPRKENDHAMDETRYAAKYLEENSGDWTAIVI